MVTVVLLNTMSVVQLCELQYCFQLKNLLVVTTFHAKV